MAIASRLLLALTVAGVAPIVLPAPPAEAACGTSWDSKRRPPETIRVYRVSRHRVDVVDFKKYVNVVMAYEWPGWVPRAAREAGATAVKQYAWYYALEGHHRSWYVTAGGVCYDVVDTTTDQLYKPEDARVDRRIRASVNATWGLSLRKHGRFFLTGYRTGSSVGCGRDADGRLLYARSAIRCARSGMGRREIQEVYYAPRVSFVWADDGRPDPGDGVKPTVTKPKVRVHDGDVLGGRIGTVSWSGSDASGIARYRLQRSIDGGRWRDVSLSDPKATEARIPLTDGHKYRFRIRAKDNTGVWSKYRAGSALDVRVIQTDRATFQGGWRIDRDRHASGSWTRYTRTDGARATLTFHGRGIAYVAPKAPGRGKVRVLIDGQEVAIVDLGAARSHPRRIVFARNWSASADRTIRIVALGDDRVDVDAFVVLR